MVMKNNPVKQGDYHQNMFHPVVTRIVSDEVNSLGKLVKITWSGFHSVCNIFWHAHGPT
jgi:hypothetical protein